MYIQRLSNTDCNIYPAFWVLVRMVLLCQSEISFPDFTLLMPKETNKNNDRKAYLIHSS